MRRSGALLVLGILAGCMQTIRFGPTQILDLRPLSGRPPRSTSVRLASAAGPIEIWPETELRLRMRERGSVEEEDFEPRELRFTTRRGAASSEIRLQGERLVFEDIVGFTLDRAAERDSWRLLAYGLAIGSLVPVVVLFVILGVTFSAS